MFFTTCSKSTAPRVSSLSPATTVPGASDRRTLSLNGATQRASADSPRCLRQARAAMNASAPRTKDLRNLFIMGTAAIPVGHEIECVTYTKTSKVLLMTHTAKYQLLTDLVTGVVYMPWVNEGDTPPWEEDDVEVESRVRGRVVQCLVQTMTHADGTAGTRLLVEVSR
ncbi:hypothetical protein [Nannocystis bainbridge]|uniref:Uncharacterized protein n=1 Tax=Nannocystis bainbridge TaxID=2995303 RepID=A0ABT5DR14_9BACT|nr:hypothetical protein [Nannocystis bainbridge]MDC0716095.1 hypothetical protein [Nannocystis bainbridge]